MRTLGKNELGAAFILSEIDNDPEMDSSDSDEEDHEDD